MNFWEKLRPFTYGNMGEVLDNVTRVYGHDGYPIIEVFSMNETAAKELCDILNGRELTSNNS